MSLSAGMFLLLAAAAPVQAQEAPALAVVEGVVRLRGARDPLPGVTVQVGEGSSLLAVTTDAAGRFSVQVPRGVGATRLRVQVISPEHRPAELWITLPLAAPLVIYLEPAPPPVEFVIESDRKSPHASRQILDRERLERAAGTYGDPMRLIQSLPGAVVGREYTPAGGAVLLRGAAPAESRVYLDGVEIPYLYHFQQYASVIHTRLLDEIAVYPSAFGAAYGDATGGVVAVRTRQADTDRVHGDLNLNLVTAGAYLTVPAGDGGALSMSGRRSYADLGGSTSDQYTLWPVFWDYLGRYDRELEPGHRISLTGLGAGDTYGRYAGDAAVLDPLEQESNPAFTFGRRFHGVLLGDDWTSGSAHLQTTVAWIDDLWTGELADASQSRAERYAWLRHNTLVSARDWLRLDLGVESRLAFLSRSVVTDRAWIELGGEAPLLARGVPLSENMTRLTGGAWVEPAFLLGSTSLQTGARLQWDTATAAAVVDPRLTLQSALGPGPWGLRAAAGRYSQAPPSDALSEAAGNPELPIARSEHAALGVDTTVLDVLELSLDGWGKRLHDVTVQDPGQPPAVEDGWAAGLELTSRYRIREVFFTWASLALGRARRGDQVFAYDQPYAINLVASWQLTPRWDLGLRYRDAAGLPYTPIVGSIYDGDSDSYLPTAGDPSSVRLPTYRKLDLHLGWTRDFRRWTLDLYAEGWYVLPGANVLYPVYNFDYSEQAFVVGPAFVPLVGGRAQF